MYFCAQKCGKSPGYHGCHGYYSYLGCKSKVKVGRKGQNYYAMHIFPNLIYFTNRIQIVRYKVFTAAKITMFFFSPADGDSMYLRNDGLYLWVSEFLEGILCKFLAVLDALTWAPHRPVHVGLSICRVFLGIRQSPWSEVIVVEHYFNNDLGYHCCFFIPLDALLTSTLVIWREEHLCHFSVLQRVRLSNLVF
jgi:hypothetical protein